MPVENKGLTVWTYKTDATAVATPVSIPVPAYATDITITIDTDVGGTGAVAVQAVVNGAPEAQIEGVADFDLATMVTKRVQGMFDSLNFVPAGVATATTYTVHIAASVGNG